MVKVRPRAPGGRAMDDVNVCCMMMMMMMMMMMIRDNIWLTWYLIKYIRTHGRTNSDKNICLQYLKQYILDTPNHAYISEDVRENRQVYCNHFSHTVEFQCFSNLMLVPTISNYLGVTKVPMFAETFRHHFRWLTGFGLFFSKKGLTSGSQRLVKYIHGLLTLYDIESNADLVHNLLAGP